MNRIEVSSSDSGPANIIFGINPEYYDAVDNANVAKNPILHSGDVYQKLAYDGRVRTLKWGTNRVANTDMRGIVDYFRSIEGEVRYFDFQDTDDINERWPTTDTWKKARVIEIKVKYKPGGSYKYDTIELVIQPEQ
jgi:hypothetical protein